MFKFIRVLLVAAGLLAVTLPATMQDFPLQNLENCRGGAFSTEEDFMMQQGEPYDGNPYISDGDVLSPSGQLCARNQELLQRFDVRDDLGLDALDIRLNLQGQNEHVVAFSTELDDPNGNFTAGDLLFTTGGIIPNNVLVAPFGVGYNIGFDGVDLVGGDEVWERIILWVTERRGNFSAEELIRLLRDSRADILFSIEGSFSGGERFPVILDGDILSLATVSIAARNNDLIPYAPAGIPDKGVDFGIDGVEYMGDEWERGSFDRFMFSTEILHEEDLQFTDGDVLTTSGVVIPNGVLTSGFVPAARFLGLDALWLPGAVTPDPFLEEMCGDLSVYDFDGGGVVTGDMTPHTGLYQPVGHRTPGDPCGAYVPIDGNIQPGQATRFRVAYRPVGTPAPAPGAATTSAVHTRWLLSRGHWHWTGSSFVWQCPTPNAGDPTTFVVLETDANGWMDYADYAAAENGTFPGSFCDADLKLAVWNTISDSPDPNGHFVLWLEWEDTSATLRRESVEHHLQLDNLAPTIAPYPDGLQVRLMDGTTIVPACGETSGETQFQIWAQFDDAYYGAATLTVAGGIPPVIFPYSVDAWEASATDNLDDTGTTPDATTVFIRNIDMTDLGESFQQCCYLVELRVWDRAILHAFNNVTVWFIGSHEAAPAITTFSAGP